MSEQKKGMLPGQMRFVETTNKSIIDMKEVVAVNPIADDESKGDKSGKFYFNAVMSNGFTYEFSKTFANKSQRNNAKDQIENVRKNIMVMWMNEKVIAEQKMVPHQGPAPEKSPIIQPITGGPRFRQ